MIPSGDIITLSSAAAGLFGANAALRSENANYVTRPPAAPSPKTTDSSAQTSPGKDNPWQDRVTLSQERLEQAATTGRGQETGPAGEDQARSTGRKTDSGNELTPEELRMIEELRARDREVRAHESAHLANAGQYARGGASFTYQQGPDGRRYAVGGEVGIDTGKEQDPEATIRKMQTVRRAALAPANPSATDRSVAAAAAATQAEAQRELQRKNEGQDDEAQAPQGIGSDEATATNSGVSAPDGAAQVIRRRGGQGEAAGPSALSIFA